MKKLEGNLEVEVAQGSGPYLIFYDNRRLGYESCHTLREGDYLRVYSKDNSQLNLFSDRNVEWEGVITSYEMGLSGEYISRKVLSDEAKKWSGMFINYLEAELIKKEDCENVRN